MKVVVAVALLDRVCNGLPEVLRRYEEITPRVQLAGPTSFAPLIRSGYLH
jgi:E3 ubiquitin-protein ligase RGLG